MTMTIDIKINGNLIAKATVTNQSDLADWSDYKAKCWTRAFPPDPKPVSNAGEESSFNDVEIRNHYRYQSPWALVSHIAQALSDELDFHVSQCSVCEEMAVEWKTGDMVGGAMVCYECLDQRIAERHREDYFVPLGKIHECASCYEPTNIEKNGTILGGYAFHVDCAHDLMSRMEAWKASFNKPNIK